ncbi:MAG: translation initiation factor IF-2 associated domain-containing protein, partial [Magnetococcus sp. YQC-5]
MSDSKNSDNEGGESARLKLNAPGRIVLRKTVEGGSIKQNFSHGRSKSVVVEVRKKKTFVKSFAEESATQGGAQGAHDDSRKETESRGATVVVANEATHKDRKQHILTPMTPAERETFHESQEQERLEREQAERHRVEQELRARQEQEELRSRLEQEKKRQLDVQRQEAEHQAAEHQTKVSPSSRVDLQHEPSAVSDTPKMAMPVAVSSGTESLVRESMPVEGIQVPTATMAVATEKIDTRTDSGTGSRTDNRSGTGPRTDNRSGTGPRTDNRSGTGPRTDNRSGTGPRTDNKSGTGPRTDNKSGTGPRTDNRSGTGPRTDNRSGTGPRTDNRSGT